MSVLRAAVLVLLVSLPAAAAAQDAAPGEGTPPATPTTDAPPAPTPAEPLAPPRPEEMPQEPLPPLASDADMQRTRALAEAQPGAVFLPSPGSARNYQYGIQLRYGLEDYHLASVDATSVQLELLFPFVLDGFLTPHVGASWGNFGRPAAAPASRAWTVDFGFTFSWIVLSWDSYVTRTQSLFNLEIGLDIEGVVQSMRTQSAAGGAVDIQSDFLLDMRPMARVVMMPNRNLSLYLGVSLSWYDLAGHDDFIHGNEVSRRPSQLVFGVQFSPQGRTLTPAAESH